MSGVPIDQESWWQREFTPPSLVALARGIDAAFGPLRPGAVGSKGDVNHTYGYHRSREWILSSGYSDYGNRDYSVTSTLDKGGDARWLSALDFTPNNAATMIACSQRLDAAVRAGLCPTVREWYGNVDGDRVVDGWDTLAHRAATSDSSHLWHIHISFYRSRAGDDHSAVLAALTGGDDMAFEPNDKAVLDGIFNLSETVRLDTGGGALVDFPNPLQAFLAGLAADVAELKARPAVSVALRPADLEVITGMLAGEIGGLRRCIAAAVQAGADQLGAH